MTLKAGGIFLVVVFVAHSIIFVAPKAIVRRLHWWWWYDLDVPVFVTSAVTSVTLALWATFRYLNPRQPPAGICRRCGYDLRATPDRCPECGTAVDRGPR